MRKFQRMLAASVLIVVGASLASAQDNQQGGGGGRQNRQFGGQDQGGNGGFGGNGGDRQNRRQFGGNNGFGNINGGFGNNGNNGNGFGRDRQRGFDNGGSTTPSTPAPLVKTERPSFVPPVATGPFVFKATQLPQEFALLNTKSIFSKDHRSTQTDVKPVVFPDAPVAALVLRGAMRLDVGEKPFTAYIEDTNGSKPPTWVVEGQFLTSSGARVTDITLDHIIVEKNGARRLITIGVNLDQGENLPNTSSGTASAGPTAGANSDSQVKIAASDAGNTSGEDVADMMRRRRQQELGQ